MLIVENILEKAPAPKTTYYGAVVTLIRQFSAVMVEDGTGMIVGIVTGGGSGRAQEEVKAEMRKANDILRRTPPLRSRQSASISPRPDFQSIGKPWPPIQHQQEAGLTEHPLW